MTSAQFEAHQPQPLSLALVGCGGMGRRHIKGLRKLQEIGRNDFRLTAACDPFAANAELAADLAAELLGERPKIYDSLDEMVNGPEPADALILTTAPDTHAPIGVIGAVAGWARWLELRLPDAGPWPARVWPMCLAVVGALLLFYSEG